ncbi:MAG TPA: tetratricopeptide repeat protein [Polyangia bacterium]|jgi:hypothetical protein|nr:tetratricopeptide repeat protein [Polyangia bacterium]
MRLAVTVVALCGVGCAAMSRQPGGPGGTSAAATSSDGIAAAVAVPLAVRTLRVRLDERVTLNGDGDVPNGFESELRHAVQRHLLKAGMAVVSDGEKSQELLLRLEATVRSTAYLMRGTVTLTAESAGVVVDQVQADAGLEREDHFAENQGSKVVAALLSSQRLLALAENRRGPPQTLVSPAAHNMPARNEAKNEATAAARANFKQGTVYYNLNRYKDALVEFEAAYLAQPDPAFLFNIAQCHRKMGNTAEAVRFYRTYLREDPRAANRAEVEKRIGELEGGPAVAPR